MATTSNTGAGKPAAKRTTTRKSTTGSAHKSTARTTRRSTAGTTRRTASTTTQTKPPTPVEQAQQIAERAVLVPVGASLLARDNLVSTVKGVATKYRTRAGLEREIKRYERRGATARNRFERQVRRTRAKFERELRQRRTSVERNVKQNRRQLQRQVKSVRKDLEKQSGVVTSRVDKLVSDAQGLIS
ncbi:MAG: hypothetical protein ACXVUL_09655 [Solirubrobacteraceae bacterium]